VSPSDNRLTDRRHILVVDDEPQITRVLRTLLMAHGYDVRVANDGEGALEIARDWPPDLMITDLSMPKMDGIELCRQFRENSQSPSRRSGKRSAEITEGEAAACEQSGLYSCPSCSFAKGAGVPLST
jgi:CheY-like chemotaxis protein